METFPLDWILNDESEFPSWEVSGTFFGREESDKREADFFFFFLRELHITKKSLLTTVMKLKDDCSLEEKLWQTQIAC